VSVDPRVAAILTGDRRAAESLLGELLPRIRNVTRSLLGRDRDVDTVAERVLLRLLESLDEAGDEPLKSWCDRITVEVALAHARKQAPGGDRSSAGDSAFPERPEALGTLPDGYAMRRDIVRLLDDIPMRQRSVLVMRSLLSYPVAEIAAALEQAPDAITQLHEDGISRLGKAAVARRGER
jgi:RNA polymerase sigma-70 factor (ECF subfamily)